MHRAIVISCLILVVGLARAQDAQPESKPAEKQPETKPAQPSLDDLLGLEKDKTKKPGAPVADPTRTELERKLSMQEAEEQFKQAVVLMGETATRIKDGKDTGLATQRLQEDIIRKLDMIISAAEQQQQQQRQRRSQQRQQQQQQQDPGSKNQQQQKPAQEHGKDAAPDTIDPPAQQDANLRPGTAARGALWGNLPERVRQALSQGDADKYSSLYRKWTEAYYRRLAEEANK
jgi:hypothetical protein